MRIVDVLRRVPPAALDDPTLVALTQLTEELDDMYFPLNKKSKRKEPTAWFGALQQHRVNHVVIQALQCNATLGHQPTLRAKKANGCLLWMAGRARQDIERTLMQFAPTQAAAGQVNSVVNRMLDILPTVIRVAEALHDVDLSERESRLMLRIQLGLPAALVPIAMQLGTDVSRPQYLALHRAGLTTSAAIKGVEPDQLLALLDGEEELRQRVLDAADHLDELDQAA